MAASQSPEFPPTASTGVDGLDQILHGGLPRDEMHLVQGVAGTGKTTLALRFLASGVANGEPAIYLTLSQSSAHLERIARSHGWSLDGITVHELSPGMVATRIAARQTILPTADIELGELWRELGDVIARVRPRRAVVDSLTIFELLAGTSHRFHREVVTLRQLFVENGCTLLALADHPAIIDQGDRPQVIFHPLSGCVIHLSQQARAYGGDRRQLRVMKARGVAHEGGHHDMTIRSGSIEVYPRLDAYEQDDPRPGASIASGITVLDQMLDGGLQTGSSCLIVGPSGVGKSSIASCFVTAAAAAGMGAAVYLFDERPEICLARCDKAGIPMREQVKAKRLLLAQINPGDLAPGAFAQRVRHEVETGKAKAVAIDSVLGYFAAVGNAAERLIQLHELMTYLTRRGVLVLLCGAQEGFMSIGAQDAVDVSYLSDTVIALTFFEREASLRRALTIVKKKTGLNSNEIREIVLARGALSVEPAPLQGVRPLFATFRGHDAG
jgi:circadian clock protein KaiC